MGLAENIEEFSPIVDPIGPKTLFIQYDLFEPKPTELDLIKAEMNELYDRQEKVRKGLFARHNALVKMFMELKKEFDAMKSNNSNPDPV